MIHGHLISPEIVRRFLSDKYSKKENQFYMSVMMKMIMVGNSCLEMKQKQKMHSLLD